MVFSAGIVLADDDINVDVSNESTNEVTATGGNAQQDQNQDQNQWQGQNQEACATGGNATGGQGGAGGRGGEGGDASATGGNANATGGNAIANPVANGGQSAADADADADASANIGDTTAKNETTVKGVEGDVTNQNIYTSPENKRPHIMAQPGPSGNFLGAGFITSKDWQLFACQPLFKSFTPEELEVMSEGAGGWFSSGIQKSLRIKEVADYDQLPVMRLDFVPVSNFGDWSSAKILGEYEYTANEPMPLGQVLAHVLFEAKKDTNTHRVVVWVKERGEVQNSGLSIGSGVAGSRLWGPGNDGTAGAIGLGGLIGTTTARTQEVYGIRVWALNDGSIDPPEGMEVCGLKVSAPVSVRATVVEEEISPQKPACDPQPIISRIKQLEEGTKNCPNDCLNNEMLRKQLGDAYLDLFYCVGNSDALAKAIAEYENAEKNFLEGREPNGARTSTLQGAQEILYKAHYNSALAIRELHGRDAEISFAQFKKLSERGDHTMPTEKNDIKR